MRKYAIGLIVFLSFNAIGQLTYQPGILDKILTIQSTEEIPAPIYLEKGTLLKVDLENGLIIMLPNTYNHLLNTRLNIDAKLSEDLKRTVKLSHTLLSNASKTNLNIEQASDRMMKKAWKMNLLEGSFSIGLGVLVGYLIWGR